ncbi:MAG: ferredoxin [Alphaproteobacteria bacterium]|nr:ferredoxin [Alphaproteobacteria bacterium]
MKRAYVNPDLCIGCGLCVSMAPEVFRLNEQGLSEAYAETPEDELDAVVEAVDSCPVKAISIVEEDFDTEN